MIGIWYSGTRYLFSRNIQGDIISIHNDAGDVVARYTYDAYGNHQVLTSGGALDTNQSSIGNINPFRYRGYYYDVETGLYYLNSRYYDPRIGRFISPDIMSILDETMMDANGLNLYMYCGNNPVMRVDPTGQSFTAILIAMLIGAAIGAIVGATSYTASTILAYTVTGAFNWSWAQFLGSVIGGAIGGALSPIPGMIFVFPAFLGGFASSAIGMGLQNLWEGTNHSIESIIATSFFIGAISAIAAGIMNGIKIEGLNLGKNSFKAISKQIYTKIVNDGIKSISAKTFGKMLVLELYSSTLGVLTDLLFSTSDIDVGINAFVQRIKQN